MIQTLFILTVLIGIVYVVWGKTQGRKKFNKKLTIFKDVGGQTVKEIEFRVKEEQLPLDPDNPSNTGWFLITEKIKGKRYVWPRPPYTHWISDEHCYIYSKSYKGNNYACLIDDSTLINQIKKMVKKDGEQRIVEEKVKYAIEDSQGKAHLARFVSIEHGEENEKEEHLGMIDIATESIAVVFPKRAHAIEPIFDERYLSEMVALHTTMTQVFDFKGFWDKHSAMITMGALIAIVLISSIFSYKTLQEATSGPIQHDLTVHVEGSDVEYERIIEETPAPPPGTPPSGGRYADILKDLR